MSDEISTLDFDRFVPFELVPRASRLAREERPDNEAPRGGFGSTLEAAAFMSRLWMPGRTLRIAFVDDHLRPTIREKVHAKVEQIAGQWLEHAHLQFAYGSRRMDAEIRIAFDPGLGNWSYIGTDALIFDDGQITMNLGELSRDPREERYRHIILHEFGHALGLIHEHQGPGSDIEWDERAVSATLSGPPNYWDPDTILVNVFTRYDKHHTQYGELLPEGTPFDPQSIMMYHIPPSWTVGGRSYPINSALSDTDKAFIAQCYPKPMA